jgi:acetate CoA/acetoacetate CoA-transferase beta subunit
MTTIAAQTDDALRARIARRVARELRDGFVVNLGIGLPTLVANYLEPGRDVIFQSENGILGLGPRPPADQEDPDLINAGGGFVTLLEGGVFFDSFTSFSMIRGGYIDLAVLGVLEVDERGNLANYLVPGKRTPGIGGGMDLATGARRLVAATEHVTRDGSPKILERCRLPLTVAGKVSMIVTDLAVIDVTPRGLLLREIAEGATVDEVRAKTGARLRLEGTPGRFA